jgi:uncharacterized protein YkwD
MTDDRVSIDHKPLRQRIAGGELPDWADWDGEESTDTNPPPDSSDSWLDDTLVDLGSPERGRADTSASPDASEHGLRLTVNRTVCQHCGTASRRHHQGCDAPLVRIGGQWRCGDCGVEMPPPAECTECGGQVDRRPVDVPFDLRLEARPAEIERAIHEETNDRRHEHALDSLAYSNHLGTIALHHSRDMAHREFFAHTNPDGQAAIDRYREYGHSDGSAGENIAKIYPDRTASAEDAARTVVDEWMASPGHRENILRDRFEREGVGVYLAQDGAVYATQNFY